ncbi:hypothetical protein [Marinobacter sp. JSM 1782161]|uniref:hypothetical protein n=1 Tax=Marinobacter sp. JSM 1782161 TaxID=2685906 RepID=UPI0014034F5B|nr:hypothetical protein [Marinobacter sp. JSM 1782161]
MKNRDRLLIGAAVSLLLAGCASTDGITVKGATDDLEDRVLVTSQLYDEPYTGFPSPTDYYFQAAIDKQSGDKLYVLQLAVNAENWRRWDEVQFSRDGQIVTLPVNWQNQDMTCNDYGCAYAELGVAGIDEPTLRYIADQSEPVKLVMRSSRIDDTLTLEVNPREAQAFLKETDQLPI